MLEQLRHFQAGQNKTPGLSNFLKLSRMMKIFQGLPTRRVETMLSYDNVIKLNYLEVPSFACGN